MTTFPNFLACTFSITVSFTLRTKTREFSFGLPLRFYAVHEVVNSLRCFDIKMVGAWECEPIPYRVNSRTAATYAFHFSGVKINLCGQRSQRRLPKLHKRLARSGKVPVR